MLSWKPVLKGAVYCAPACGGRCTLTAYKKAKTEAKACLRRLKYKGFKIHVWENLGWHWELRKGGLTVHPSMGGEFYAMLNPYGDSGDSNFWHSDEYNKDPNKAIANKLQVAKNFIQLCTKAVRSVEA